jgi:signal peptidase I
MSQDPRGPAFGQGDPNDEPQHPEAGPPPADAASRDPLAQFRDLTHGRQPEQPGSGPPAPGDAAWRRPQPAGSPWQPEFGDDPYTDVPASLELAYTSADVGLSPNAYERTFPYEQRRRKATGARLRRVGRELVETVILALLIFFAVRAVVQNFRVEGSSMQPSLHGDQYLLVNKAIYYRVDMDKVHQFLPFVPGDGDGEERHLFRAPRRGDVIVFKYPGDTSRDFIKRVIGVPGDTVEVKDGTVFINGAPLKEDYILATPNYTYGPKTVPEGHYFVLGDNRRNSFDSHAWGSQCQADQACDFVPEENIIGQAWVTYWPFDALGFVNNKVIKPIAQ